jgi:hypothetical protein
MQKALALFLLLALCCFAGQGALLYAQEENPGYDETIPYNETAPYDETIPDDNDSDDGSQPESDFDRFMPDMYSKGDQTVTVSLGAAFPAVFFNNGRVIPHNIKPPVGGVLSLAYSRFLGPHLFIGGEVGFASAYTLGQNALFIIPIGVRAGWQFVFRRFEFPLYAAIGIAPQRYLDLGYFGMYLKGAASAYYRFHPNWSFGISVDWSWYPQWPKEDGERIPGKDVYANIIGVLISARYHF